MKYCALFLFSLLFSSAQAQDNVEINKKINRLKLVTEMPYICHSVIDKNTTGFNAERCGDSYFWEVVQLKDKAIEALLDKLDDTTLTTAVVPLFGYYYRVADIAYVALQEIIHCLHTFHHLRVDFDEEGCGYCAYWQHLNKDYNNRLYFQKSLRDWYAMFKDGLYWKESNTFTSCDCSGQHPNGGHYLLAPE